MDANQQRFWQIIDAADWPLAGREPRVELDRDCRRMRLRDRRPARVIDGALNDAEARSWLPIPAEARDAFGSIAFWDATQRTIFTRGLRPTELDLPLAVFPAGTQLADMALGNDDVLYLSLRTVDGGGNITRAWIGMLDRLQRWTDPQIFEIELLNFTPGRLAPDPAGGVWSLAATDALQPGDNGVAHLRGYPLRDGQPGSFRQDVFRPTPENPVPPILEIDRLQPEWNVDEIIGIASSAQGRIAILTWRGVDESWIHVRDLQGRWAAPRQLIDAGRATSITFLSDSRIAAIPAARTVNAVTVQPREAVVYDIDDETPTLLPAGGFLPLRNIASGNFVQGTTLPKHYVTAPNSGGRRQLSLAALSVRTYESSGRALGRVIDSREDRTTWHRIYLEGSLPPGCGIVVLLAASDDLDFTPSPAHWAEHHFGTTRDPRLGEAPARGAWLPDRSELPAHPGLLDKTPQKDRYGLFTALIQRPGTTVRALRGRYLHVAVQLLGNGHATPEIAAIRFYGSRFSYRDKYLPELYRETLFGNDADQLGSATGPDFLERFLGLFESVLTPLEDRVAGAHLWTHPNSAPDEALDWLGSWIGVLLDPTFPVERRRAWIHAAHRLYQTRGTFAGLQLALEIGTGGSLQKLNIEGRSGQTRVAHGGQVTGGEIIVVEDFKLRRTMASILGANLTVENDPLLPGLMVSSNSHIGDTLILGETELVIVREGNRFVLREQETKEFLALFRNAFSNNPNERRREEADVAELFDDLAFRVTILVHDAVEQTDLGLIRRIAEREAPAHLEIRVERATRGLMVGLSSLVDVDTYLVPTPAKTGVEVGRSRIGESDFILRVPSLDPRIVRT